MLIWILKPNLNDLIEIDEYEATCNKASELLIGLYNRQFASDSDLFRCNDNNVWGEGLALFGSKCFEMFNCPFFIRSSY